MIYIETVRIKLTDQQTGTGQTGRLKAKGNSIRQPDGHYSSDSLLVNKTIEVLENEGTQLLTFLDDHQVIN